MALWIWRIDSCIYIKNIVRTILHSKCKSIFRWIKRSKCKHTEPLEMIRKIEVIYIILGEGYKVRMSKGKYFDRFNCMTFYFIYVLSWTLCTGVELITSLVLCGTLLRYVGGTVFLYVHIYVWIIYPFSFSYLSL